MKDKILTNKEEADQTASKSRRNLEKGGTDFNGGQDQTN